MATVSASAASRRTLFGRRLDGRTFGFTLFLAFVAFLVITPLLLLLLNSFEVGPPGKATVYGLDAWVRAYQTPGIGRAIYNTFSLAIARSLIAAGFVPDHPGAPRRSRQKT